VPAIQQRGIPDVHADRDVTRKDGGGVTKLREDIDQLSQEEQNVTPGGYAPEDSGQLSQEEQTSLQEEMLREEIGQLSQEAIHHSRRIRSGRI